MKRLLVGLTLSVMVAVTGGCGSEKTGSAPVSVEQAENLPVEHKLIILDNGTMVPGDDPRIARARELLARASAAYGLVDLDIAEMVYVAAKLLKKEGVDVSAVDVLEAVTLAHVNGITGKDQFASTAGIYANLRKGGQPHVESMMGLKGLLGIAASHQN